MNTELNCYGGDYGISAAYDVDMCEGCPRDNWCYKVHQAFMDGKITDAFMRYSPKNKMYCANV